MQQETHYAAVPFGDVGGPRTLAVPEWNMRLMKRGIVPDETPGISQFGEAFAYDAGRDMWIPSEQHPLGRRRRRRFGRRIRGAFKRMRRGVRRFMKRRPVLRRIVKGIRRRLPTIVAALPIPGARAAAVGIRASRAIRRMVKGRSYGACVLAARSATPRAPMGHGIESGPAILSQNGAQVSVQPIGAIVGVPGVYEFGALEVSVEPEPGGYYRIQKGDTLFGVAGKAFEVGAGRERLNFARWINRAAANASLVDAGLSDSLFPSGRISFSPKFSADADEASQGVSGRNYGVIWIPPAEGVEPPEEVSPEPVAVGPEPVGPEPVVPAAPMPMPPTPLPPPEPVVAVAPMPEPTMPEPEPEPVRAPARPKPEPVPPPPEPMPPSLEPEPVAEPEERVPEPELPPSPPIVAVRPPYEPPDDLLPVPFPTESVRAPTEPAPSVAVVGPMGPRGPAGVTGSRGPAGPMGPVGPVGPAGAGGGMVAGGEAPLPAKIALALPALIPLLTRM